MSLYETVTIFVPEYKIKRENIIGIYDDNFDLVDILQKGDYIDKKRITYITQKQIGLYSIKDKKYETAKLPFCIDNYSKNGSHKNTISNIDILYDNIIAELMVEEEEDDEDTELRSIPDSGEIYNIVSRMLDNIGNLEEDK